MTPEKPATPQSIAQTYDALADKYDAQLNANPVAEEIRKQLHAHLVRLFTPGTRVLDFSAGTGADALFLVERGVSVTALDLSPEMIRELRRSAVHRGLQIDSFVLPAEQLGTLNRAPFDGAISTFGGINTMRNLPELAKQLHAKLKPDGALIIHGLNSFCFWQWVRGLRRGRLTARGDTINLNQELGANHFYNPYTLWRESFKPYFALENVYAQSIIAAPPLAINYRRAANALFAVDRALGRFSPASGDFFVMQLRRRNG